VSGTNEPVAWAVTPTGKDAEIDCEFIYPSAATAGDVAIGCSGVVVPLYSHSQPTLTDEEREAIRRAIFRCTVSARARRLYRMDDLADEDRKDAETFSGLLKRIG
jgi:hypothetical protein